MKKSNEILFFAALIAAAFVVPSLRAEPADAPADRAGRGEGGPGRRGGAMMERAAKELGLTADQEARWKEIGQRERAAREAIRNDPALSKEDKKAKAMETNKGFGEQRRAVLTAEQQTRFDEMRVKMRERGERGPRKPKTE